MTDPQMRFRVLDIADADDKLGAEVPDPLFSHAVLAAFEDLVATQASEDGWDAPPQLGLLYQRERTPVEPAPFHGISLEWHSLPVSTKQLMDAERPHHVIVGLAYGFRELPQAELAAMLPQDLVAVAILTEAWMVVPDAGLSSAELKEMSKTRNLHAHPQRIEIKVLQAVDINGVRYLHIYPRDKALAEPTSMAGLSGQNGAGGDVPNSLHYLMEAMQGRDLPDWQQWWTANHDYDQV